MRNIVCCLVGASMLVYACVAKSEEEAVVECAALEDVTDMDYLEKESESVMQFTAPEIVGNSSGTGSSDMSKLKEEDNTMVNSSKSTDKSTSIQKKIIKDGDITIKTSDIAVTKQVIDSLVKRLNAYYERENFDKYPQRMEYNLKIRVPAANFEKLVSSVEQGKDKVERKNIRARDVTEEFVDLTIRLTTKREYLKQYTVLLSRAAKIADILEIQEKIRNLQEEIESAEGRLRYLNDQVTFSTLEVELYQKIDYVYEPAQKDSFIERIKSGLNTGWEIVKSFVIFLTNIWSVLVILIAAFFFIRWRIKKRKARKNS